MPSVPNFTKAHCNACGGQRNHVVLHDVESPWKTDDQLYEGVDQYETLQCAGCDSIKLRNTATYSWEPEPTITYFPPPVFRPRPHWFTELQLELALDDMSVYELLNEIYVGLQNGMVRSPAMAARALLELVMIEKVQDQGSFAKNVAAFATAGFVSSKQRDRLLAILEAGHASIHRSYSPSKDDLVTIVDMVEHLIESIYVHESKIQALVKRIPERAKK